MNDFRYAFDYFKLSFLYPGLDATIETWNRVLLNNSNAYPPIFIRQLKDLEHVLVYFATGNFVSSKD